MAVMVSKSSGMVPGARKVFKSTVEITLDVVLPGDRKQLRLQRGVIPASVLRNMLLSWRPKGRRQRKKGRAAKRTGKACAERRKAARL